MSGSGNALATRFIDGLVPFVLGTSVIVAIAFGNVHDAEIESIAYSVFALITAGVWIHTMDIPGEIRPMTRQDPSRTTQADVEPTPLEVTDIELSDDGELVVTGRWHVGGHYGSKAANATVDLSETSIAELIEDG